MPTILTLFKTVLRKLTPAEVDQNFENLRTNLDKLGGYAASQAPVANQIPVVGADKHMVVPGGIKFPAAQVPSGDANTLDDYEEGTWTPVLAGSTAAGANTYAYQVGKYTKIGNRVFFNGYVECSALSGMTGNVIITGLPAASVAGAGQSSAVTLGTSPKVNLPANYYTVGAIQVAGTTQIALYKSGVGVENTVLSTTELSTTFRMYFEGHYPV